MKAWLCALAFLAVAPAAASSQDAGTPPIEARVLAWINWARANPADYAERLRQYRGYFRGRLVQAPGDEIGVMTREGPAAVDEAIAYVERQAPLPPLDWNDRLAAAAGGYVAETGPSGVVGHVGPSGRTLMRRIRDAGYAPSSAGEVIAYGPDTAEAVVRQLIIDDGVPGRGHRTAIFDASYRSAGAGCGPHRVYRTMCVVDFAGGEVAGERRPKPR
jgi:hypothetical protein